MEKISLGAGLRLLVSAAATAVAVSGCSGSNGGVGYSGGDGGAADGGAGAIDGGSGNDGGVTPIFADSGALEGGQQQSLSCSGDLRNVVNSAGQVVQACPANEGCSSGACIPACAAAAAAKGTIGCDYVVATPSFYPSEPPPCFAIFLANNWGEAATVQVTRAGTSYDVSTFGVIPVAGQPATSWAKVPSTGIPPGQVGILFMSASPESTVACPVTPAISSAAGVYTGGAASTGIGSAWHIVSSVPVTSYDIYPYGGASSYLPSAELLIPTSAWTTNYFGIVPYRGSSSPQWGQIVAMTDNTTVNMVPSVALPSGTGVTAAPAKVAATFKLNAGQFIQWQDSGEMSSTVIQSSAPVGFTGGLGYDCYQSMTSPGGGGCDSAHQQIPPISALGNDYVAAPFASRQSDLSAESIPYRVVGAVDGTVLTYDPPGIAPAATTYFGAAPLKLAAGQVVEFETTKAFRITSQDAAHPFFVAQITPGCNVSMGSRAGCSAEYAGACCLGDEEFVNVLPAAQFRDSYIFFTDLTYATTNLVVTRVKTSAGFQDVTLDCAGTLSGWQPVGTNGQYEVTNVDLVRGGTGNGKCNNGPHSASSNGPFGLTVWGLDYCASYAYPAGGNVAPINAVVVPPKYQ